jgi:RimJ/RimL family protein N-acetyltransferase
MPSRRLGGNVRTSELHGALVRLRPLRLSDAAALDYVLRDRTATRYLPARVRKETGREFIARALRERHRGALVPFAIVPLNGTEVVGQIRLFRLQPSQKEAEVGFWIRRKYWGQGFGTDALRILCRLGFRALSLHRIEANVVVGNVGSRRALEKAGFQLEGQSRQSFRIGRRWHDDWRLGLLRGELRRADPKSPRSIAPTTPARTLAQRARSRRVARGT